MKEKRWYFVLIESTCEQLGKPENPVTSYVRSEAPDAVICSSIAMTQVRGSNWVGVGLLYQKSVEIEKPKPKSQGGQVQIPAKRREKPKPLG